MEEIIVSWSAKIHLSMSCSGTDSQLGVTGPCGEVVHPLYRNVLPQYLILLCAIKVPVVTISTISSLPQWAGGPRYVHSEERTSIVLDLDSGRGS